MQFGAAAGNLAQGLDQMFDAPLVELLLASPHPAAALLAVQREQLPAEIPQMFASVVDVDDLDGIGKV